MLVQMHKKAFPHKLNQHLYNLQQFAGVTYVILISVMEMYGEFWHWVQTYFVSNCIGCLLFFEEQDLQTLINICSACVASEAQLDLLCDIVDLYCSPLVSGQFGTDEQVQFSGQWVCIVW